MTAAESSAPPSAAAAAAAAAVTAAALGPTPGHGRGTCLGLLSSVGVTQSPRSPEVGVTQSPRSPEVGVTQLPRSPEVGVTQSPRSPEVGVTQSPRSPETARPTRCRSSWARVEEIKMKGVDFRNDWRSKNGIRRSVTNGDHSSLRSKKSAKTIADIVTSIVFLYYLWYSC